MSQILEKIRDVDPNDSEAVKEALSTFFQNLSKHVDEDSARWLRALENIINRFPKYCTSHRSTIETHLTHYLDSNNYHIVIEAAKCMHGLQQVKFTQDKGATAKVSWREQMSILCQSAHELINVIFTENVKIYKNNNKVQRHQSSNKTPLSIALHSITNVGKSQNRQAVLCTRLGNIFVLIQAMLVEIYPVAKPVQPQIILEVILQSLTVSSGKNVSVDVSAVKIQALKTLDALVACLGPNLIPFSALVFRFVMQTLRWSSDNVSEKSSKVRCAAYNSLSQWLEILRVHQSTAGSDHSWQEELTNHLIMDITPQKKLVQLTMNSQPNKHLSKKAKRKLANTMLQESTLATHMPGEKNKITLPEEVNEEVALAALECTETFLTVCGIFLKASTHKVFQETLVRESYQGGGGRRTLGRLRALEAARRGAPASVAPPTHHCLHLYTILLNSPDRHISKFCSQALLDIRLHLHCSPPSLNFALDVNQHQQNKADEKQKKISNRNRAVLEQLLGAERMPSEELAEQVITIPDEPSNKKRRLDDDVDDKISLSSDSLVVSSDDSDLEVRDQDVELIESNEKTIEPIVTEQQAIANVEAKEIDHEHSIDAESEVTNNKEINKDVSKETTLQIQENVITSESTELAVEINVVANKNTETNNIFEAKTQLPMSVSIDTSEREQSPLSMEVGYDYPNAGKDKVTVLDKLDDENLPSTNDTDDIQITCGQVVKNSQDVDLDKNKDVEVSENVPKVNGIAKSPERNADVVEETNVTAKIALSNDAVTVEDMLADFVDEVIDNKIEA